MIMLEPLNVAMSLRFAVACTILLFFMKTSSLQVAKQSLPGNWRFFFLTPLPSLETWKRSNAPTNNATRATLLRCLIFLVLTLAYFYFYWTVVDSAMLSNLVISYFAAPLIWMVGEWITALMQIISLSSGRLIPPHHHMPLLSKNLTEFWGKRWNTWFYDWFHQALFRVIKRRPLRAIMITFLVSGIGHEIVIDLPFYLLTGKNVFGTMTAFFVIQGIGVILDNKLFRKTHTGKRFAFLWFWLLLFAPLFMNEGTLRLIHAIP